MFDANKSRLLYAITDLLSLVALGFGIFFAIYGVFSGFPGGAIWGGSLAGTGLSLLIVTHIGRALVSIAQTNIKILEKLSKS